MKQIHYIQGKLVLPPKNYQDVYLQGNKDNDGLEVATTVQTFEWINEEAAILKSIFQNGVSGGQGLLSGVPHIIKLVEDGTTITIFNGYIDLQTARFDQDLVIADSVPRLSIEWLDQVADSINFETLWDSGLIPRTKIVFVPYVLNSIPNYKDLMIVSLTTTFITLSLQKQTSTIIALAPEIASIIAAPSGVFRLISEVLYTITLLISVFVLINDLIDLIIQQVKYKPAMSLNTHILAACQALGVKYESDILTSPELVNLHIIPASYANPEAQSDNRIQGFLQGNPNEQTGYYKGTFGDLLREIRELFNLRIVFRSNTLHIERRTKTNKATFTLPSHYNPKFETNASEFVSNYEISFAYDTTERTTIDQWTGNNVQVMLEYKIAPIDGQLRLLKGLNRISTRFSRGFAKTKLTQPEKAINGFLRVSQKALGALVTVVNGATKVINKVLDAIDKIVRVLNNLGANIEFEPDRPKKIEKKKDTIIDNRLGMLSLENDYFAVDKLVILDVNADPIKTKVSQLNALVLDAENIYRAFHQDASFDPSNSENAQRFIYNYENVEMNLTEFDQVIKDGAVKLPDGTVCEVISYEYNAEDRLANFVIEEKKIYTNNVVSRIIKPTGQ